METINTIETDEAQGLPTGWDMTRLEDVVDILDSQRVPINSKEREKRVGQVPYYGATGQVGWIDDHLFDEELVLLGEDGAPFLDSTKQKAYIIRGKSWVNNHAHVLRARNGIPNPYIKYYLDTVDYHDYVTGTTRLKLNQAMMRKIPVPVAPPTEQKLIVAEIEKQFSRLDEAVANLKRVKANLKRYKAAVLKAAVTGKLTEEWRKQHPDVEPANKLLTRSIAERKTKCNGRPKSKELAVPDIGKLTELPVGWVWATYEQLGYWKGGGTPSKNNPEYWTDGVVPWISPKDMKSETIVDSEDKITKKAIKETVAKLIPANSILFVVRSGILRRTLPIGLIKMDAAVNQDLKALTPLREMSTEYLLIASLGFAEDIRQSCQKNGTTVESIAVPALQVYPIPVPPAEEQLIIVQDVERRLSLLKAIEDGLEVNFERAKRFRQSILHSAFSGNLMIGA